MVNNRQGECQQTTNRSPAARPGDLVVPVGNGGSCIIEEDR
jgi:hypothetical protein